MKHLPQRPSIRWDQMKIYDQEIRDDPSREVGYAQILAGSHASGPDASTYPNTQDLCLDITEPGRYHFYLRIIVTSLQLPLILY
eukprot:g19439.t1